MRYVDEYRDAAAVQTFVAAIGRRVTRPWTLMEICGGQTHTLIKSGIDHLLPDAVTLVHGPGCPVCVTPLEQIDRAIAIARRPGVIFTSFGDRSTPIARSCSSPSASRRRHPLMRWPYGRRRSSACRTSRS